MLPKTKICTAMDCKPRSQILVIRTISNKGFYLGENSYAYWFFSLQIVKSYRDDIGFR